MLRPYRYSSVVFDVRFQTSDPVKKQDRTSKAISFTSVLERSTNGLWGAHVRAPGRIAAKFAGSDSRRVVCTLNDTEQHQCAILPFGNGTFVITVNKKRRDSLGLEFGMDVEVTLRKDQSKYGLPLPEELQEALRQDAEGSALFHALTPGRRRTLLYTVASAKSPDKRVARAIIVLDHLKANKGKINYRQLYLMLQSGRRTAL